MIMAEDSISIELFMKQIDDQLKAGVDPIILTPSAVDTLYPLIGHLNPELSRANAQLLMKLRDVTRFHANAFDFPMPGRIHIARWQFWEFHHFMEKELHFNYDPAKIPEGYAIGMEYIFEAFSRLRALAKQDIDVKHNYNMLSRLLCYLIKEHLHDNLHTPVFPTEYQWRDYQRFSISVLNGFPYIARKKIDEHWVYTNIKTGKQFVDTCEMKDSTLAALICDNTVEHEMYENYRIKTFSKVDGRLPLFDKDAPWNKK